MLQGKIYTVNVGNIGTVYSGENLRKANDTFNDYVELSLVGIGRASGEVVWIFVDGELLREHPVT